MRERGEGDRLNVIKGVRGGADAGDEALRELPGTALLIDDENLMPGNGWGATALDHLLPGVPLLPAVRQVATLEDMESPEAQRHFQGEEAEVQ